MDFDVVSGGGGATAAGGGGGGAIATTSPAVEARAEAIAAASGDVTGALAAAIVDPGRIELADTDRVATLEPWLREQASVGVALVVDDPRPLAGTPLSLAVAGEDGRVVAADGADASTRPAAPPRGRRGAPRRPRRQAAAHRAVRRGRIGRSASTSPSTPRSRPTSSTPRSASQKIADVVAERLDLVLPPTAAGLPPTAIAGLEALSAVAVRPSLEQALRDDGVDRLFEEIELPLIPILARMEAAGDRPGPGGARRRWSASSRPRSPDSRARSTPPSATSSRSVRRSSWATSCSSSSACPKGRKTKTGYSTDASVLEELRGVHPVIEPVLDWRIYTKLRSTYVEALPTLIGPDGRLHTLFHQAVAATGRLSSSDPNLQNIPIRTPLGRRIRHAFVAGSPDTTLVAADYSQIELRILAHVSGDDHLADAFAREADIHRETAARVLRKDPADVTSDERSMAKMVNFGLAYGMSDFGLSSRAGISRQDAQEFINSYFAAYGGISRYMHHIRETAREQGYVATLLGRKRRIPELEARNPSLRAAGERMAINMPIQGTAADIVKIAMIRTDRALREGVVPRPAPALRPRRAPARGAARRGRPAHPDPARGHGGRAPAVRAAHRRGEGRRLVGGDGARLPSRRGAGRGGRGARGDRGLAAGRCPSCPRSRRSRATCAATCSRATMRPGP